MMKRFQKGVGLLLSTAIANSLVAGSALADHCDCDLFELEYESGELIEPRFEAEYFYGYEPEYQYQSIEFIESPDESIDATERLENDPLPNHASGWENVTKDESSSNSEDTTQISSAWGSETPKTTNGNVMAPENVMTILIALGLWFGLPALFSKPKAK